jgi:hypothetical protein
MGRMGRDLEYAIDVWHLAGTDHRVDGEELHKHLRDFGKDGWQLASITFNVQLRRHGASHLLIFTRPQG